MENKAQKYISKVINMEDIKPENSTYKILWDRLGNQLWNGIMRHEESKRVREKYKEYRRWWELVENFRYWTKTRDPLPDWFDIWKEKEKEEIRKCCEELSGDIDKLLDYLTEKNINIRDLKGIGKVAAEKFLLLIQKHYEEQSTPQKRKGARE